MLCNEAMAARELRERMEPLAFVRSIRFEPSLAYCR